MLDLLWLYLPGTGDSTGTAAQWVWVWSEGRGEMGGGGGETERQRETHHQSARWIYCASTFLEQKIGLEQQHSVGCYCCCYLGGTGEDEKLADLLWLWLSETSECVQCVLGI